MEPLIVLWLIARVLEEIGNENEEVRHGDSGLDRIILMFDVCMSSTYPYD